MKELATKLNNITERYLDIIGIIFIVVNFIIWDLNTITLRDTQFSLYYLALYFVLVGIIINIKKLNILEYLSEIILFTLLFFVLVYNSYQINMSFHGTYVDMGLRSRELIKLVFPSLFLILLLYRYINPKAFIIGLLLTTGIILFYNIVAIYGKLAKMETLFQLPLLLNNRSQSLLDNPNALGEYAYLGCVFLFILAIISKRLSIKIITLALIPIMLGGLVLSGSRTALLMVISFYVLLLLYYPYYNRQFKNLLIISFLLILGFVLVDYTFHLNFIKEQLRLSDALSGRDKIWKVMMTVINENWLYGVGYNNSTFVFNESGEFSTLTSPHNLYLAVLMEMGIIPFILMVTFFIGLILSNQKLIILNKGNHKTMYLIIFNIFYVSTLIGQFFEHGLFKLSTLNTVMFMCIAFNLQIKARFDKLPKLPVFSYLYLLISIVMSLILYFMKLDLLIIMTINVFPALIFIVIRFLLRYLRYNEVPYEKGN
ncbi:MAG: O-antigen ligase family protein [Bacilli bacterium]|nr:O-antigen ligase family protein [Bacilli bacterium]